MGPGDRGLRQQDPAGPFLGVRVRDVQAHSTAPRRADLEVGSDPAGGEPSAQDLHVPDQLRQREGRQVVFDFVPQPVHVRPAGVDVGDHLLKAAHAVEHVLVGERRRGVDAIDDDVGAAPDEQPVQVRSRQNLVRQLVHRVFDDRATRLALLQ